MSLFENIWKGMGQKVVFRFNIPLGTGYTKPMRNLAVLVDAICEAYDKAWIGNKDFAPLNGITHCNQALQYVAKKFGYDKFDGLLANDIIDVITKDSKWSIQTPNEAAERAMEGWLVIATKKATPHGHVCIVRPGTLETSAKWKENAPKVMNIGKDCFISKGANFAFRDKPDYYALIG